MYSQQCQPAYPAPRHQKHPIFEVLCIFFIWSNYSPALDGASDHHQQAIIARSIDGSPVQPFLKFFFSSIFAPSFTSLSAAFVKMTPAPVFHLLRPNCVTEYVSECGDLAQTPQQHCHQVDNRVFFISLINSQMVWKEILCFFRRMRISATPCTRLARNANPPTGRFALGHMRGGCALC